jgi:hypothetical protein
MASTLNYRASWNINPIVRTLVVRIYRSPRNRSGCLLGIVEEVGVASERPFNTLEELWEIVAKKAGRDKQRQPRKSTRAPGTNKGGGVS